MATIPIIVKHQGKKYTLDVDLSSNGEMLKMQLFSLTEVPPTGQKILVKGGQLKDETALSTLNLKANQTLIMMGKPGESSEKTQSIEKPKEQHRFIEDMTEAEAARSEGATPSGLVNLGNTCYLNSSIQVLRAIPDLRHLVKSAPNTAAAGQRNLTTSLRDLFTSLSETQGAVSPVFLWTSLQAANEQFTERNRNGTGFAQQDAEEAWSTILQNMKTNLVLKGEDGESASFVDKYMRGRFESVMTCTDADAKEKGEMPIESSEDFMKLSCHIDKDVNHLRDGITAGLHEMIDKHSPTLDRNATYEKQSRIARLPKYLTVHFVRFFWKRDSRIKAKIMRKVTFPEELDVVEFCSDDLKKKLIPIRDNIRDIRKEELDLERSRKRQKIKHMQSEEEAKADTPGGFGIQKSTKEPLQKKKDKETEKEASQTTYKTDADYDAEHVQHLQELKSNLKKLLAENASLADSDPLANKTGLYDLTGIVAHQGPSADSGHYTAFVKKSSIHDGEKKEDDGKWWWFNDDKVTEVEQDRIMQLAGGGEGHTALICLYRAVDPAPYVEEQ